MPAYRTIFKKYHMSRYISELIQYASRKHLQLCIFIFRLSVYYIIFFPFLYLLGLVLNSFIMKITSFFYLLNNDQINKCQNENPTQKMKEKEKIQK